MKGFGFWSSWVLAWGALLVFVAFTVMLIISLATGESVNWWFVVPRMLAVLWLFRYESRRVRKYKIDEAMRRMRHDISQ